MSLAFFVTPYMVIVGTTGCAVPLIQAGGKKKKAPGAAKRVAERYQQEEEGAQTAVDSQNTAAVDAYQHSGSFGRAASFSKVAASTGDADIPSDAQYPCGTVGKTGTVTSMAGFNDKSGTVTSMATVGFANSWPVPGPYKIPTSEQLVELRTVNHAAAQLLIARLYESPEHQEYCEGIEAEEDAAKARKLVAADLGYVLAHSYTRLLDPAFLHGPDKA